MRTLKIWEIDGYFICNDSHYHGGNDMYQRWMFHHLFPDTPMIPFYLRDMIYLLANAHNWEVEITKKPVPDKVDETI